jgi:hypothetical protein
MPIRFLLLICLGAWLSGCATEQRDTGATRPVTIELVPVETVE